MTDYLAEIPKIIDVLKKNGTILYPTDTIWGIGCDATNEEAVRKIYEIKQREYSKSLIILVSNVEMLSDYVAKIPAKALEMIDEYTTPLTIIYEGAKNLAANTIAEDGTIAIRIPKDDFCHKLIDKFGKPVVSTSANISGEPAPVNFSEISHKIINKVDYSVKYRQNKVQKAKASTIIKILPNDEIIFIRK